VGTQISSRTPEGIPGRCPVCRERYRIERSLAGDATCPRCGSLVWPREAAVPSRVGHAFRLFAAALRTMRRVPGWAYAPALDRLTRMPRRQAARQVERLAAVLVAEEEEDHTALSRGAIAEKLAYVGLTVPAIKQVVDAFAEWRELEAARRRIGWWGRLKRRVVGPPLLLAH
jgi:hypothetical protein